MKSIWLLCLSVSLLFLSGCGKSNQDAINETVVAGQTSNNESRGILPHEGYNTDGKYVIFKDGLDIHTTEPTEGVAAVAWEFFKLRGQQQYEEALKYLKGYGTDALTNSLYADYVGEGRVYLEEVMGAKLLRWTDITQVVAKESEDEGSYVYKVIYLEMEFVTRGKLGEPDHPSSIMNGVNIYAVHVVQMEENGPWIISLLGGCPPLEA